MPYTQSASRRDLNDCSMQNILSYVQMQMQTHWKYSNLTSTPTSNTATPQRADKMFAVLTTMSLSGICIVGQVPFIYFLRKHLCRKSTGAHCKMNDFYFTLKALWLFMLAHCHSEGRFIRMEPLLILLAKTCASPVRRENAVDKGPLKIQSNENIHVSNSRM